VPKYEDEKGEKKTTVYTRHNSPWEGDQFVEDNWKKYPSAARKQIRTLTQSRLFITYSLHRRVFSELEARSVLERMADAVRKIFGDDEELCRMIIFGQKLQDNPHGSSDAVSSKHFMPILKPNKKDKAAEFYGSEALRSNSYIYDTYTTHVESVEVDAGMEIGPTYHHPHFHCLLTVNHFSYIQFDTFLMSATLEQMFKGTHKKHKKDYMLFDGAGLPFYTDNEKPYIDIRTKPADNWAEVVAAYVRKGADKESMLALRARTGDIRKLR